MWVVGEGRGHEMKQTCRATLEGRFCSQYGVTMSLKRYFIKKKHGSFLNIPKYMKHVKLILDTAMSFTSIYISFCFGTFEQIWEGNYNLSTSSGARVNPRPGGGLSHLRPGGGGGGGSK